MRGLKAAANNCHTSSTRKLSVEVDGNELQQAFVVLMLNAGHPAETALALWPAFWSQIKQLPSYTVRINGRVTIKRRLVVNKQARARAAALRRQQQQSEKLLTLGKTLASLGTAMKAAR
jgi:hypothetical protein